MQALTARIDRECFIGGSGVPLVDGQAAYHMTLSSLGQFTQKCEARAIFGLLGDCRLHGETGGKHFRQDNQTPWLRFEAFTQGMNVFIIGDFVFPGDVRLKGVNVHEAFCSSVNPAMSRWMASCAVDVSRDP